MAKRARRAVRTMGAGRVLALGAFSAVTACASVTVPLPGIVASERAAQPLQEHTALRAAALALADATPPAADEARKRGLHTVVFGGRDDAERAAARIYLDAAPTDVTDVLADAGSVLEAARAVSAAGKISPSGTPSETDVHVLEEAIGEVQRSRRLLTTALRLLREDGAPVTKSEIRELGDAFVDAAREIGTAADLAAARTRDALPVYADRPGSGAASY